MDNIKIFDAEYKFMEILWDNEPIKSSELVKLAHEKLSWKKSTTFTVIRRLVDRGIISNDNSIVTALVKRELAQKAETEELIDKVYGGSIKTFFASFLQRENLTKEDIDELRKIVDNLD
ncbi:BlaI/MecI/CopY family transcriptional regulator [Proteiniborus sp.]|uniref:BlaI/MecI/CopY family transcriptional regulator n=1 Tax=Proteiniborus sp. TaxID=2079015 RepID=UPI003317C600